MAAMRKRYLIAIAYPIAAWVCFAGYFYGAANTFDFSATFATITAPLILPPLLVYVFAAWVLGPGDAKFLQLAFGFLAVWAATTLVLLGVYRIAAGRQESSSWKKSCQEPILGAAV